jgi:pilus assembly protein CpaF
MSLLQRVERAQQEASSPNAGQPVPVMAPVLAPQTPAQVAGREDLLRSIRLRLQAEVISAFDTLLDEKVTDIPTKITGIVDRTIALHGFAVTRDERLRLIDEMANDVTGFGPLEPLLKDETITEVMVNGPSHIYIERDGKITRVDSVFLNDEHVLRVIDRIITPMGRRIDELSPRVDARLPDG